MLHLEVIVIVTQRDRLLAGRVGPKVKRSSTIVVLAPYTNFHHFSALRFGVYCDPENTRTFAILKFNFFKDQFSVDFYGIRETTMLNFSFIGLKYSEECMRNLPYRYIDKP